MELRFYFLETDPYKVARLDGKWSNWFYLDILNSYSIKIYIKHPEKLSTLYNLRKTLE